jgi:periplasmic divalent cation tolerance protein
MISVYLTTKDLVEAKKIASKLLENKLIACANMFPIESMFKWKGKIVDEAEVAMFCKAKKKNFDKIKSVVEKLHSYEVPCIVSFDVHSNKAFEAWVYD